MDFLLDVSTNQIILYFLHFISSFLDAFIFSSFFVAGEVFFLSGGYLSVNYLDFFICYIVLVLGALFGDNLSYFIGKKYGRSIFLKNGKIFNEKQLERGEKLLKKHGVKIIFFSRFVGPFYWLIPTISGIFGVEYKKFFFFNFAGICVGILHFMLYGYFFAIGLEYFGNSIFINLLLLILLVYFGFLFISRLKIILKLKKYFLSIVLFLKYFLAYILSFLIILGYYFFYLYPIDSIFYSEEEILDLKKYISEIDKKVYSDKVIKTNSNPINIVIVSDKDISEIMEKISWKKNMSFSSGEIIFFKFIELLKKKEPPISDFYHNGFNQNSQYQDFSNSNSKRNHIRFWKIGQTEFGENIYIGAVSQDKNFSIMINNGLPIIGHSIYKNIDLSRNIFKEKILENFEKVSFEIYNFPSFSEKNYFTDGDIFVFRISS